MSDDSTTTINTESSITSSSSVYVTGISGFDTSALIEAAVASKMEPAYTLADKIEENELKYTSYSEMQSLLSDVQDTLDALRNEPGTSATESVFSLRSGYLTAADGSDATDFLGIDVEADVTTGSYELEVIQLATKNKVNSDNVASSDEALGYDGVISLGTDAGTSAEITITSDMTLEDIEDAINEQTEDSGVTASILKVTDDEYTLILTTSNTGETIDMSSVSGDDVLQSLGVTDSNGDAKNVLQEAQNAILAIDGVEVERSSNTIDDAIDGITLDLYAVPDDTTITLEINNDYTSIKEEIVALVDAYNAYREFAITHQQTGDEGATDDAVLFADSLLKQTNNDLYDAFTTYMDIDDESFSLADFGITFDDENYLVYDEDALDEAIIEETEAMQQFFEFQMTSTDEDFQVLRHDEVLASGEFELSVVVDEEGNVTEASIDGDSSLFTVSGTTLTGADGSAYEGLKIVFTGDESATTTITISEGVADSLYDTLDDMCNASSGLIQNQLELIEEQNDNYEEKYDDIVDSVEDYQERLISQYAEIETAIAEAEILKAYIEAAFYSDDD